MRFAVPFTAALALAALCQPSRAEVPALASFAEAIELAAEHGKPVQQLPLPAAVYAGVVSPQLADVAVFDAAGTAVPHVFCAAPLTTRTVEERLSLPVFPVRLAQPATGSSAEVRTDGGRIAITLPSEGAERVAVSAYDLDLSALQVPAVSLRLGWSSPTGLSEVRLKLEQGDTAGGWQPLLPVAVLRRLSAAGQTLESADIALPPARYTSLRLTPQDAAGTVLDSVQVLTRQSVAVPETLRWLPAATTATSREPDSGLLAHGYDAATQAPVTAARLWLSEPNSRQALRLQSRADSAQPWQTLWTGEAFLLVTPEGERRNADITLPMTRHRDWRVLVEGAAPGPAPVLQLGHAPELLRFVAQGQGPYRLAYGNTAASNARAAGSCQGLLQPLLAAADARARLQLIGTAVASEPQTLAGAAARQPAPGPPLWHRGLLWAVLALAVLLLLWMARSLLADLKTPKT